jgi:hypothetical protein
VIERRFVIILVTILSACYCRQSSNEESPRNSVIRQQQLLLEQFPVPDAKNKLILDSSWTENNKKSAAASFVQPTRMLFGADQRIYVSDLKGHVVLVFEENGKLIQELGKQGHGPEDLNPLYIGELSNGRTAIFDSRELKIKIMDKLGQRTSSFRVFKPCFAMSTNHEGHFAFNFFDQNDDSPLINIFNEAGHELAHIGTRLKGNSPFFNVVDIFESSDGIYVAWRGFPLVRKYSESGKLLFEHYLDYGPLKKNGELNRLSSAKNGGTNIKGLIWRIWAEKEFYYLLIGYPRLEILRVDLAGNIKAVFWDDIPENFLTNDFFIREENGNMSIYVLEIAPIPHIRRYLMKNNYSSML